MSAYLCVSGATQTPVDSIAQCLAIDSSAYVMASVQTLATQPTLQDIFAMPLVSDWQTMWLIGFGTPIFCYLLSHLWQVLIGMFNTPY